jgi:hypothetical protein
MKDLKEPITTAKHARKVNKYCGCLSFSCRWKVFKCFRSIRKKCCCCIKC